MQQERAYFCVFFYLYLAPFEIQGATVAVMERFRFFFIISFLLERACIFQGTNKIRSDISWMKGGEETIYFLLYDVYVK